MPFGYYKPPSFGGGSKPKPAAPSTPAAPPARAASKPAPMERGLMDYDKGRAKRQMSRPIFGGRR